MFFMCQSVVFPTTCAESHYRFNCFMCTIENKINKRTFHPAKYLPLETFFHSSISSPSRSNFHLIINSTSTDYNVGDKYIHIGDVIVGRKEIHCSRPPNLPSRCTFTLDMTSFSDSPHRHLKRFVLNIQNFISSFDSSKKQQCYVLFIIIIKSDQSTIPNVFLSDVYSEEFKRNRKLRVYPTIGSFSLNLVFV